MQETLTAPVPTIPHPRPAAEPEPTPEPAPVVPASIDRVLAWLAETAAAAGPPASVTITEWTHTIDVAMTDKAAFDRWTTHVTVVDTRTGHDDLVGDTLTASADVAGWSLLVYLYGSTGGIA